MAPFSPSQGPVVPDDTQTPPTGATSSSGKKKKKKKISKSERKRRKRAREQAEKEKDVQDDKQVKGKEKDQDKRNDNGSEEIVSDGEKNLTEKNYNKQHIQGGAKREIHESPPKKKISDQAQTQTPQKNEGGNGKIIDVQACKRIISSSLGVEQPNLGDKNTDAMKLQNTKKQVQGTKNNKTEGMALLALHTSESSRPLISFVYPKKDKQTMMGKPVSYVHTKARTSHGEGNEHEHEHEGHNNDQGGRDYVDPKQRAQEEELRGDSIDDILFPKRKKKTKAKTEGRSKGAADGKDDNKDSKLVTKKQTDAPHVPMSPMAEHVKEGNADVKGTNLSFEGMQVDSDSDSDDSDWAEGNDEDDQESMSTDQSEGDDDDDNDDEVVSSLRKKRKSEEHLEKDRSELKEELKEDKAKEDIDNEDANESKEAKLLKEDVDKDNASRDTRKDGNSTNGHESESQTKLQAQGMEETTAAPKQRRARSDSLSDPLKTLLSGRTVQDAIQDASGRRPRSNSTDSELKLPKRGLCDERMVVMNYKWDHGVYFQKRVMPRGLINLGNTCFLNSTLQCLVYLPTFCQCVAMLPNQNQLNGSNGGNGNNAGKKKKSNSGLQMTVFLRNLIRRVHGLDGEAKHAPLAPKAIVRSISSLGGGSHRGYKFRPGRQEDAHEFLVHLLGAMNDGELKAAGTFLSDCNTLRIV